MNTQDREMHVERLLPVSLETLWEMWANPEHIAQWWGPNGFTNTIDTMEFKEGGEWLFTMHGPDGKDYPNRSVFMEIIPMKKIVFQHYNPNFLTTVLFEPREEGTYIDWCGVFETKELFDTLMKIVRMDEALEQNLDRLTAYLGQQLR